LTCLLTEPNFFGQSEKYMKSVYDQLFDLKYYGGFSIFESCNLPCGLRNYYSEKLRQRLEDEAREIENASKKRK